MPLISPIRDDIRYGYAVGRVRVLEGRLLSRTTFERLIDAADVSEQKRILSETHVGRYLEGAETAQDVERGLESSLADLYDEFLCKAALPEAVVSYFRAPHDYANLRLVIKSRIVGGHAPGRLSPLGSVPPEAYRHEGEDLPPEFDELLHAWDGVEEPLVFDDVVATLDRSLFAALTASARASRLPLLRGLTQLRIDLANARLFIRARAKGLASAEVTARTIPGGSPALEAIAPQVPQFSPAELAEAIAAAGVFGPTPESDLVEPERFDVTAALLEAQYMRRARMAASGADPVLAYVLAREAEALQLRTAVAGRLAGLDPERIRDRLRERLS